MVDCLANLSLRIEAFALLVFGHRVRSRRGCIDSRNPCVKQKKQNDRDQYCSKRRDELSRVRRGRWTRGLHCRVAHWRTSPRGGVMRLVSTPYDFSTSARVTMPTTMR